MRRIGIKLSKRQLPVFVPIIIIYILPPIMHPQELNDPDPRVSVIVLDVMGKQKSNLGKLVERNAIQESNKKSYIYNPFFHYRYNTDFIESAKVSISIPTPPRLKHSNP